MKYAISIVLFLFGITVKANQINFQKFVSLDKALNQAKKENKLVFFDTYASWCGWCSFMDENIFNEEDVANYFNKNFIAFKVDADAKNTSEFSNQFDISGLPALLILDKDGKIINRNDGAFTDPSEFIEFGKLAYYKYYPETSPWYKYGLEFDAGKKDCEFLKNYATSLLDADNKEERIIEMVNLYWDLTPSRKLVDTSNFYMFYLFVYDLDNEMIADFIENKVALIQTNGEETYYQKGIYLIEENLSEAVADSNTALYNEILVFANKTFENQNLVDLDELLLTIKEIWEED